MSKDLSLYLKNVYIGLTMESQFSYASTLESVRDVHSVLKQIISPQANE